MVVLRHLMSQIFSCISSLLLLYSTNTTLTYENTVNYEPARIKYQNTLISRRFAQHSRC